MQASRLLPVFILLGAKLMAQQAVLKGRITSDGKPIQYAAVKIEGLDIGALSDDRGNYIISAIPFGKYSVLASQIGYTAASRQVTINKPLVQLDIKLSESSVQLDQVVVTGTRTAKKITHCPVMVDVINSQTLMSTQSLSLSEGLRFQPGLRVETDCQTCNYTQLRMNGLQGGYSQILINSRPILSALAGLYGMEQIPSNMIDRIEVVRGGGSALYGPGAVGGTVNVITKVPVEPSYGMGYTYQNIDGTAEHIISGNAAVLSHKGNAGAAFFANKRRRNAYDANGDNFSELPELENNAFGVNFFFIPGGNQKINFNISSLNEYRYGGDMVDKPAYLALQAEERTHHVTVGNADYELRFNDDNSSLIAYLALQNTRRDHYTGIFPDTPVDIQTHLKQPPYGTSDNTTKQAGFQLNHKVEPFAAGSSTLTVGAEYLSDGILDVIEAYDYNIAQVTKNFGAFFQSDWVLSPRLSLLSGLRVDKHNLLDRVIASPRFSLLYKLRTATQLRAAWGTGFRAPQAFDSDLHIAFAGGGLSRAGLSDDLKEERSSSLSASINFDKVAKRYIFGFTLESFYTRLRDAFYMHPLGEDAFGEVFEKRNGDGAVVRGFTLEGRAGYDEIIQLDAGITLQSSKFDTPVVYVEGLEAKRAFLRTPNEYGFTTLTYTPAKSLSLAMNVVYTGSMHLAHFAGAPELTEDEYTVSPPYTEWSLRASYTLPLRELEFFAGIKNISNAYQTNFDSGKNRDSNFVFGPAAPRTFYLGVKVKSF